MRKECHDHEVVGPYHCRSVPTYQLAIYVGGDAERAGTLCREWVDRHPRCVTVEPLDFVYTGGRERGVRVQLINYPRFPATPIELWESARRLAFHLLAGLDQQSLSIVGSDRTEWISRRAEDLLGDTPAR